VSVPENDLAISTTSEYDRISTMAVVLRYESSISMAFIIVVKMTHVSDWHKACIEMAHQANRETLTARVASTVWIGPPAVVAERIFVSVVWHPDGYYRHLEVDACTSRL
jgi:hypothetical protein